MAVIVDYPYTSRLEDRLDLVAEGHEKWLAVVDEYYKVFLTALASAGKERVDTMTNMPCPKCDAGMLMVKFGREGEFMGCTRYPDCSFTSDFVRAEGIITLKTIDTAPMPDVECPLCKGPMMVRRGRFGNFLACIGYPTCKGTQRLDKNGKPVAPPEPTGITCPKCEERELLKRKGAFGRPFYGCSGYPKCDYIVNDLAEVATYDPEVEAAKPPRRSAVAARANAAKNAAAAAKAPTKRRVAPARTTKNATAPTPKSTPKTPGTKKTTKPAAKSTTKAVKASPGAATRTPSRPVAKATKTATPRAPRSLTPDREVE